MGYLGFGNGLQTDQISQMQCPLNFKLAKYCLLIIGSYYSACVGYIWECISVSALT